MQLRMIVIVTFIFGSRCFGAFKMTVPKVSEENLQALCTSLKYSCDNASPDEKIALALVYQEERVMTGVSQDDIEKYHAYLLYMKDKGVFTCESFFTNDDDQYLRDHYEEEKGIKVPKATEDLGKPLFSILCRDSKLSFIPMFGEYIKYLRENVVKARHQHDELSAVDRVVENFPTLSLDGAYSECIFRRQSALPIENQLVPVQGPHDFSPLLKGYSTVIFDGKVEQPVQERRILPQQSGHFVLHCLTTYLTLSEEYYDSPSFWGASTDILDSFSVELSPFCEDLDEKALEKKIASMAPVVMAASMLIDKDLSILSAATRDLVHGDEEMIKYIKSVFGEYDFFGLFIKHEEGQEEVCAAAAAAPTVERTWTLLMITKDQMIGKHFYRIFNPHGGFDIRNPWMQNFLMQIEIA